MQSLSYDDVGTSPVSPADNDAESSLERFECPLCELVLCNGDDLYQHVQMHAGEQDSFKCQACGKECPDVAMFGKHLRVHTHEKPFKCTECGKGFREKCSLTRHARTHTGEKPFTCDVCEKSFSDVGSFGRHKKTHMGQKAKVHECPFDHCTKSFIDKSSLKRHVKTHTGEKPFQCQVCSKCFTESGSYKRHLRVHTGEKRYKCRVCGRAFSERASMVRHERNVCMMTSGIDHTNDLEASTEGSELSREGNESPYSLTDFFKSFVGKSSDKLNNNIYSSFEEDGSNDTTECGTNRNLSANYATANDPPNVCGNEKDGENEKRNALSKSPLSAGVAVAKRGAVRGSRVSSGSDERENDGQPSHVAMPDRICNIPTKMLQLQHLLEKPAEVKAKPADTQMCFECGDVISDYEDDDQTAHSDSASTASDSKKALRCSACRQEAITYTNGESSPAVFTTGDSSPATFPNSEASPAMLRNGDESPSAFMNGESSPAPSEDSSASQRGQRRNRCSHCGKTFADSSKLKRHVKIHLGMRDFKCRTCGKGFIEACSLRRHESVHSDVKPHNCSLCGKGFTDSSGLKKHLIRCNGQVKDITKVMDIKVTDTKISEDQVKDTIKVTDTKVMNTKVTEGQIKDSARIAGSVSEQHNQTKDNSKVMNSSRITEKEFTFLNIKKEVEERSKEDGHVEAGCQQKSNSILNALGIAQSAKGCHIKNESSNIKRERQSSGAAYLDSLKSNTTFNHEAMVYICRECGKSCDDEQSFKRHIASHGATLATLEEHVSCHVCGKMFVSVQYLLKHMKNHNGVSVPPGSGSGIPFSESSVNAETLLKTTAALAQSVASKLPALSPLLSNTQNFVFNASAPATSTPKLTKNLAEKITTLSSTTPPPSSSTPSKIGSTNCEVCGKVFADASSLKRHSRLHTEQQQPFPCKNCSKVFWDQGSLKRHWLRGCKGVVVATKEDSAEAPDQKRIKLEPGADEFACTQCRKVFNTREEQMTHEKAHRVSPSLRCNVCRKSFSDSITLGLHLRVHASERPHLCEICFKGFADSGSLSKHRARGCYAHAGAALDPSKLPCADCGKVFSDQSNFDQHMSSHRGVKPYSCTQCGKSFTEACSLKRHTRLHTGQNLCRCLHCGRTFLENSGLKKHLQRQSCQQEKKPVKSFLYPCHLCQKVFTKRYILLRHMKTHLGLRPFACDKCDKSFTESSSLKRHYRQHTGERPYWCGGCKKTFTDAGVLKKHKHRCPYITDDDDLSASLYSSFFNGHHLSSKWAAKALTNKTSTSRFPRIRLLPSKTLKTRHDPSLALGSSIWHLPTKHCWRCGRHFASVKQRHLHARAAHSGLWTAKCRSCWRRFSRLSYLRVHTKLHKV
ncbi:zinc finger protein 721-like [Littorina saxatilis]|uniref:C2H2-type domain-containing protein n=1 Tax=Littorina saxatilis TaxID=31220 RepID=A0AAN9AMK6_9CAEN